jgi:hypothetical protein
MLGVHAAKKISTDMVLCLFFVIAIPVSIATCMNELIPSSSEEMALGFAESYYDIPRDSCVLVSKQEVLSNSSFKMNGLHVYEEYYLVDFDIVCNGILLHDYYVGVLYNTGDTAYFRVKQDKIIIGSIIATGG